MLGGGVVDLSPCCCHRIDVDFCRQAFWFSL